MHSNQASNLKLSAVNKKLKKADSYLNKGNSAKALHLLNEISITGNYDIETGSRIARLLFKAGNARAAIELLSRTISAHDNNTDALMLLGSFYKSLGMLNDAVELYKRVMLIDKNNIHAEIEYATIHSIRGNHVHAIEHFQHSLELLKNGTNSSRDKNVSLYISCYNNLGLCHTSIGEFEQAQKYYHEALLLKKNSISLTGIANLYERMGKKAEALDALSDLAPNELTRVGAALVYSRLLGTHNNVDKCIRTLEKAVNITKNNNEIYALCLQLGKTYESIEEYDKSFIYYRKGNDALGHKYNKASEEKFFGSIKRAFSEIKSVSSNASNKAVFILGMPRSGTSLVEQILSSHKDVTAGGEQAYFHDVSRELSRSKGIEYPACISAISTKDIEALSAKYNSYLDNQTSDIRYTDKLPHNFLNIGLINLIAPNAYIIHCKRDPIDTCLSCYTNEFSGVHAYAHRLDDLCHYYSLYQDLVSFWKSSLNIKWHDISYEDLVCNTDETIRQLISFIDIDWDDSCLKYYESKRAISTASYDQANKPVYTTSIQRWKKYEKYLGPLLPLNQSK